VLPSFAAQMTQLGSCDDAAQLFRRCARRLIGLARSLRLSLRHARYSLPGQRLMTSMSVFR
jgi:hypothetical protein